MVNGRLQNLKEQTSPSMTVSAELADPRWEDYVLDRGAALQKLWSALTAKGEQRILFVLGRGFDPRMCVGVDMVLQAGGSGRCNILAIEFDEGDSSPSYTHSTQIETNWAELQRLTTGRANLSTTRLHMWSRDHRRVSSRNAARIFNSISDVCEYTDVIIDISTLPRSIFFPLIAKVLYLLDSSAGSKPNLHVFVAEDSELDKHITQGGIDEAAAYVHGFGRGLDIEATAQLPRVWIPLLGERQLLQLKRVHELVSPNEVCPVLPSPSVNPRRSDNLVPEYREFLLDGLRVEPRNFIFASEWNPFEVYLQIRRCILQFREALEPLGGCKVVLSAHSSKLLSVGALLAAYELHKPGVDVGIAQVESEGYIMQFSPGDPLSADQAELWSLWLAGEPYETQETA